MKEILTTYDYELTSYYAEYGQGLESIFADGLTPDKYSNVNQRLKQIAGSLGASVGKAGQRAKRDLVFYDLLAAKENGVDLTFHKVQALARKLTGRPFDNNSVHGLFSKKGRTAGISDRCQMTEEEEQAIIDDLTPKLDALQVALEKIRRKHSAFWQNSPKRRQIYRFVKHNKPPLPI